MILGPQWTLDSHRLLFHYLPETQIVLSVEVQSHGSCVFLNMMQVGFHWKHLLLLQLGSQENKQRCPLPKWDEAVVKWPRASCACHDFNEVLLQGRGPERPSPSSPCAVRPAARLEGPPAAAMLMRGEGSGPLSTGQSAATTGGVSSSSLWKNLHNPSFELLHITTAPQM